MNENFTKWTALYMRLSQEDERSGESMSITNQRMILTQYAKKNGFINTKFYCDDGYSGVDFNRPDWQRMMDDATAGKIAQIITKDLSRAGRNHLHVGLYTEEIFPKLHIRFIAIADQFDTADPNRNPEFAAIFNIFNEMHVKTTSQKIRAIFRAKALRGERVGGNYPYGYLKPDSDSPLIIPDPETAPIVKRIFQMCVDGYGATRIANQLTAEKIPTPSAYRYLTTGKKSNDSIPQADDVWRDCSIRQILENCEYVGDVYALRHTTVSYKDKTYIRRPDEECVLLENDHEPIISRETWDIVQRIVKIKKRRTDLGDYGILSGILYCEDCGHRLTISRAASTKEYLHGYVCSSYRKYVKEKCTRHFVNKMALESIILEEIRRVTGFARDKEREFAEYINKKSAGETKKSLAKKQRDYERQTKRISELVTLFAKIYEDNVLNRLTDEQFNMLAVKYNTEQNELKKSSAVLKDEIENLKAETDNAVKFISLAKKYSDMSELTPEILNTFISKVIVHEKETSVDSDGKETKIQHIDIVFTHIGIVEEDAEPLPVPKEFDMMPNLKKIYDDMRLGRTG